jgi:hypothetical protein
MLGGIFGGQANAQVTQPAQGRQPAYQAAPPKKDWVYCIPVMPGFPTPHAISLRGWMRNILVLQVVACAVRIFYLKDIVGGLWMGLTISIGGHAYFEGPMNITYICCWGLACLVNGILDVLGAIFPLIFGILSFNFMTTIAQLLVPLAYAIGAFFAYHLYLDFARENNLQTSSAVAYVPDIFVLLKSKIDHGTDEERGPLRDGPLNYDPPKAQPATQPQQQAPDSGGGIDAMIQGMGASMGAAFGKAAAQGAQQEAQNQVSHAFGRGGQSPPGSGQIASAGAGSQQSTFRKDQRYYS